MIFLAAVAICAWLRGGFWPGLTATVGGYCWVIFSSPNRPTPWEDRGFRRYLWNSAYSVSKASSSVR